MAPKAFFPALPLTPCAAAGGIAHQQNSVAQINSKRMPVRRLDSPRMVSAMIVSFLLRQPLTLPQRNVAGAQVDAFEFQNHAAVIVVGNTEAANRRPAGAAPRGAPFSPVPGNTILASISRSLRCRRLPWSGPAGPQFPIQSSGLR